MTLLELEFLRVNNEIATLTLSCMKQDKRIQYLASKRCKKKRASEVCRLMKERLYNLSYIEDLKIELSEILNQMNGTSFCCENEMTAFGFVNDYGMRKYWDD